MNMFTRFSRIFILTTLLLAVMLHLTRCDAEKKDNKAAMAAGAIYAFQVNSHSGKLSDTSENDLIADSVTSIDNPPSANSTKDEIRFSQPVGIRISKEGEMVPMDPDAIAGNPPAPATKSRSFWMDVTGKELNNGIQLPLTTDDALLRITPASASAKKLDPYSLQLKSDNGEAHQLTAGDVADDEQMTDQGMSVAKGSVAFRVSRKSDQGFLNVRTSEAVNNDSHYLINVQEKNSNTVLNLRSARSIFGASDKIVVEASLMKNGKSMNADEVTATVKSPSGRVYEMTPTGMVDGKAVFDLDEVKDEYTPGVLWEAEVKASNGEVMRNGRVAFARSFATARYDGDVNVSSDDDGNLLVELSVEVGTEGRYAASALLYGTGGNGELRPVISAQTGKYLTGSDSITLVFEAKYLKNAGVVAPFEIRDVRLMDQSRISVVHQQAHGFAVDM